MAFLDELLAKRDRGELGDHVTQLANEKCKRPNTALFLNSAGAGVGLVLSLMFARWLGRPRVPRLGCPGRGTSAHAGASIAMITQRIVLACAAYFVIVLAILHVLEPEFDPRFRFMSEYALGDYGWLMTTTFFALGLASIVAAVGLRTVHQSSRSTRIGLGLLLVAGIFIWLAGIFKDSTPHLLASVVVFPSIVMAVLLLSWTLRQAAGWHNIYRVTLLIAIGLLAAFLSIAADVGMPGLQQRVFIFLFLLWLAIVFHGSVRIMSAAQTVARSYGSDRQSPH